MSVKFLCLHILQGVKAYLTSKEVNGRSKDLCDHCFRSVLCSVLDCLTSLLSNCYKHDKRHLFEKFKNIPGDGVQGHLKLIFAQRYSCQRPNGFFSVNLKDSSAHNLFKVNFENIECIVIRRDHISNLFLFVYRKNP